MTETVDKVPAARTAPAAKVGVVAAKSSDKTIRVEINTLVKHPQYGKYQRRRTRLSVHDPANEAAQGDTVEISPCRRMSRTKSWRLVKVVRRGSGAEPLPATDVKG